MLKIQPKCLWLLVFSTLIVAGKFIETSAHDQSESIVAEEALRNSIVKNLEMDNVAEAVSLSQPAEDSTLRDIVKEFLEQRQFNFKTPIKYGDHLLQNSHSKKALPVFEEIFNAMAQKQYLLERNELFYLYYAVERATRLPDFSNDLLSNFLTLKNAIELHKNALVLKKKALSGKSEYHQVLNKIPRSASLGLVLNSFIAELTESLNLTEKVNLLPLLYYVENRCYFANLILENDLQNFENLSETEEAFALWLYMKHQIRFFYFNVNFTSKGKCYSVLANLTNTVKPMWEKYDEDVNNGRVSTLEMKFPTILHQYQNSISPESLFVA